MSIVFYSVEVASWALLQLFSSLSSIPVSSSSLTPPIIADIVDEKNKQTHPDREDLAAQEKEKKKGVRIGRKEGFRGSGAPLMHIKKATAMALMKNKISIQGRR
jgi:hypothetical protein